MEIKVLGTGCARCKTVGENVQTALAELGLDAAVEKVTDLNEIADHGVMMTPGLIINGRIKASGRVPGVAEIKKWLTEEKQD